MDPFIEPVLVPFIVHLLAPRMDSFIGQIMDMISDIILVFILYNIIHPMVRSASGGVHRDGRDVVSLLPNRTRTLCVAREERSDSLRKEDGVRMTSSLYYKADRQNGWLYLFLFMYLLVVTS